MKVKAGQPIWFGGLIAPAITLCCLLLSLLFFFWLHGYSSGDDLPFHLGSWAEASRQLRKGVYPQWDIAAACGAGEPRFVFYPPLSWLLGALLRTFATPAHAAEWFVCLAFAACWLGMYWAARQQTSSTAASIAATVYAAAPYTLFNGLQRAAFGELLASALLPLLFAACISPSPSIAVIAVPLALVWLTNIPTAILASYLLLTVAVFRLVLLLRRGAPSRTVFPQAAVFASGAAIGLLLCSFFLLPALLQQKDVQLAAAFSQGQSFRDNFLLRHTAFTSRQTLHAVTLIVVQYAAALIVLLGAVVLMRRRPSQSAAQCNGFLFPLLAWLSVLSLLMLLPLSAPVWQYLPKLSVLQFPWRFLSVLTLLLAFAAGLLADRFAPRHWLASGGSAVLAALLISVGAHTYWRNPQKREATGETRAEVAARTESRATQEYTPIGANNTGLQPMRVASCTASTHEHAGATPQDLQVPPLQMTFHLLQAAECTLPVRDYPAWTVLSNGKPVPHAHREDGRIVLLVPAGESSVGIQWNGGPDRVAGSLVSAASVLVLLVIGRRRVKT